MALWLNRSVLSGSSVDPNGTTSHTCTFTPATSGNYLVAIVAGAVTFTTPSGWTLVRSAILEGAVYVFAKTATGGESSFSTTHNGSNYAIRGIVYEFAAGTTLLGSNSGTADGGGAIAGPSVTGLGGTYTGFAVRACVITQAIGLIDATWTVPSTEEYEVSVGSTSNDGIGLSVAYQDGLTSSTFSASYYMSWANTSSSGEAIVFALAVVPGDDGAVNLLRLGTQPPDSLYLGATEVEKAYLGTKLVYGTGEDGEDNPPASQGVLFITPATGTFAVNDTVQFQIRANSFTTEVNTVQANLSYPTNRLTFQSISRTGSPFTTAIQEQGGSGTVKLGVGILAGYTSGDQLVGTITFTANAAGTAAITFDGDSAIATYAESANILDTTVGATYTIT